ncbi:hypothetical protein VOLCADRAFT_95656 [Volvox carteri f. nagariensis]|uniref:Uncharacterized protein n=1 Tax=Volvox carteri f. nagariensis TaxID=3068 RepID=D8U7W7_VOLCA|nr:uncharacterized protein VOLCADRAFT_95656 [Volvox carteri f. nagariensis]EFJ44218.1 hypothetical protein VOLCADRAFT_95656 [Volvox carteri f. nagariensis]|eukprot:XP_002954812.1 hypothetical protein VOLCADRAFT_95656 [Volvox carteri f. nagariensis]
MCVDGCPIVDGVRVPLKLYADDLNLLAHNYRRLMCLLKALTEGCSAAFGVAFILGALRGPAHMPQPPSISLTRLNEPQIVKQVSCCCNRRSHQLKLLNRGWIALEAQDAKSQSYEKVQPNKEQQPQGRLHVASGM